MGTRLTHDETLQWITEQRAWRTARKTKPILARPVEPEDVGRSIQTADRATERAQAGAWLCVGSANEPWFQSKEKLDAKYQQTGEARRRFRFDDREHTYRVFTPRSEARNWAAQVTASGVEGFYIQPNYPTDGPLYSPVGGYVVKDHSADPYAGNPNDVWLVQQDLFESTYEISP